MVDEGSGGGAVTQAEMALFTRQLGAMLDAGVDVLRALKIAGQNSGSEALIEAGREIGRYLEDGREFHDAISHQPELFGAFYVEMTRQGEADGMLGRSLLAIADSLDHGPGGALSAAGVGGATDTGAVLSTLGAVALGVGGLHAVAALLPAERRARWVTPASLLWAGSCLLVSGRALAREPRPGPVMPLPPQLLPGKAPERLRAETDGVVRSALDEQDEERQERGPGRTSPGLPFGDPEPPGWDGRPVGG